MHAFVVPKARRPRFDLKLQIHDLNNVPLVSGLAYVKWHIRDSPMADSRGRTSKVPIKDHRVTWRYTKELVVKMTVDRTGMLSSIYLDLEIVQEYSGRERIVLGSLEINLAEYVCRERETRRYLMQASKINSTLQISTELRQISGDVKFKVPELKPAQVFSGIAGVKITEPMVSDASSEQNTLQSSESPTYTPDLASMPSYTREKTRNQDIYRRTLAASWQLQAGELNAVDCIENIFSGGNGWTIDRQDHRYSRSENLHSDAIDDENDGSSMGPDVQSHHHRNATHRLSLWHGSTESAWKRSRSFQNVGRHSSEHTVSETTNTSTSRLGPFSGHKTKLPKSTTSISRTVSQNTTGHTNNSISTSLIVNADPSNNIENAKSNTGQQTDGWQRSDLIEENLRDNLVSWTL